MIALILSLLINFAVVSGNGTNPTTKTKTDSTTSDQTVTTFGGTAGWAEAG